MNTFTNVWRQLVTETVRDFPYSAGSIQMVSLPAITTVFSASCWRSVYGRSSIPPELNFLTRSETNLWKPMRPFSRDCERGTFSFSGESRVMITKAPKTRERRNISRPFLF